MSSKGSNGILDGLANAQAFLTWQAEVEDFKPYVVGPAKPVTRCF